MNDGLNPELRKVCDRVAWLVGGLSLALIATTFVGVLVNLFR